MKTLQIINFIILGLNIIINIIAGNIPAVLGWSAALLGWIAFAVSNNNKSKHYE